MGSGGRRASKPNARLRGIEPEAAVEIGYQIDEQWTAYGEDFESFDAGQRHNMGMLPGLGLRQRLTDGETL